MACHNRYLCVASGRRMGDVRASILSHGVQLMPSPGKVNLRENRLTALGTTSLLTSMPLNNVVLLDLARNDIGAAGCGTLCTAISVRTSMKARTRFIGLTRTRGCSTGDARAGYAGP